MKKSNATPFWFWAWLMVITVPKRSISIDRAKGELWQNLVLISAANATEALAKANQLGRSQEGDSCGSLTLDGVPARSIFIGVEDIGVIHDDLIHGGEILFKRSTKIVAVAKKKAKSLSLLHSKLERELAPYNTLRKMNKNRTAPYQKT